MSTILGSVMDHYHWQYRQWLTQAALDEIQRQADRLALRRDMVTLLAYVRDNKVVGTKSTGNMPLRAIREVTSAFVEPPALDTSIGDRIYTLRTEFDVWPLYLLHILAQVGDLLDTPVGARWQLTPEGVTFLSFGSLDQVLHLLYVWWFRVNWVIAYPLEGLGETIPRDMPALTLRRLHAMPVGRRVEFESFADALVKRTGLTWGSSGAYDIQGFLQWSIRRMVVEVAASFGIVELETEERAPFLSPDLLAFRVTSFGRLLLSALEMLSRELGR